MTENELEGKGEENASPSPKGNDDEPSVKEGRAGMEESATSTTDGEESSSDTAQDDTLKDIEMVKCPRCGKETPKSVRMCMFCGYNLVEKPYIPIEKKKAKMIKWLIGIPLIILFIVLYFFLRD